MFKRQNLDIYVPFGFTIYGSAHIMSVMEVMFYEKKLSAALGHFWVYNADVHFTYCTSC